MRVLPARSSAIRSSAGSKPPAAREVCISTASHMSHDDEKRAILRTAIGPHTARWAEGKGLLMQLNSLEQAWPHLFALPAAALEGKERPWVARDESDSALEKAYKRAALHLHPDRLVSQNRDLSVRVEAEEVRAHRPLPPIPPIPPMTYIHAHAYEHVHVHALVPGSKSYLPSVGGRSSSSCRRRTATSLRGSWA